MCLCDMTYAYAELYIIIYLCNLPILNSHRVFPDYQSNLNCFIKDYSS